MEECINAVEVDQDCRVMLMNYFYLVYRRYQIAIPDEADWRFPQLPANVQWEMAVEVPRMLIELGEMNEDTRVAAMLKLCKCFKDVDESNFLHVYTTAMDTMISSMSSLEKMKVFCAFSAGYCIYLCKQHNMNDNVAIEVYQKAQKIFQFRFKFWLDCDNGWEEFLAKGRRLLRKKQIADYQASLVKIICKGAALIAVTGLAVVLVEKLKDKL